MAELIRKRQGWITSSQENNFDFDSILAGLYNDPSHFVYEILQNAEDASAKTVHFELFEDKLDIRHNGRDFDFKDIEGVTGIGISTKKTDLTAIGKFGVGFKSVFAVTETPHIFSGEYNIRIEDFVVPVVVTTNDCKEGTLIRLPFNHKFRPKEDIYNLVDKKLKNIGLKTLLFLRNIEEIRWSSLHGKRGHYIKETKGIEGAKRVTVISEEDSEEYIVLERPITIDNRTLKTEVAFKLGKDKQGKEIVVPEPDSKLVVYFPTEKVTFLSFLVQGPYKTTPNRENIPLDDEQNKMIIEETGKLIADSLSVIRRLGYLDSNFLSILPIHPEHREKEPIYSALFEKVKEKFLSDEDLLPTAQSGIHASPGTALLARGKELTEFLNNEDIRLLFSKQHWLDTNITYDKTKELRDYLINDLGIKEVDFEVFAKSLTKDFLQTRSDEWVIGFYSRLLDQEALWRDRGYKAGILRTMPIIRLDNGEHIEPFDKDGKAQVYLPSEKRSEFKTVKRQLTESESALKFLKELGLLNPDLFAEIKEFILPKYHSGKIQVNEDYYEDFEKLLTVYETISSNKKKDYVSQLKDTPFISSINCTKQGEIRKPTDVYFGSNELEEYFADNDKIYFISSDLINRFGVERLTPFLQETGIADSPRRIQIEGKLTYDEKVHLRSNGGCTHDICQKDFDYEGLTFFLERMTSEKSFLLWSLLLEGIKELDSRTARNYFRGDYGWFYYSEHTVSFDATFLKALRQTRWLVNREGMMFKPLEVTFSELADEYIKESPNVEILIKELQFKPEIIDQLPPEDKKKYELTKNYTPAELEKILAEHEKKSGAKTTGEGDEIEKGWEPDHRPDEIDIGIEGAAIAKTEISGIEGQTETLEPPKGEEKTEAGKSQSQKEDGDEVTESLSATDKKKIGTWGEEVVFNALKKEYVQMSDDLTATDFGFKLHDPDGNEIELVWLNIKNNVGEGCDFVRKENGTEVEYIEVKTKLGSHEELIEITGKQWESARTLYERGEGNKYSIYVVSNAGQANTKIMKLNNPIALWKEGKLYAHPINFRL